MENSKAMCMPFPQVKGTVVLTLLNEEIVELAILLFSGGNISVINENTIGFIHAAKIPVKNLRKTNK
jgi:hypothetical protein